MNEINEGVRDRWKPCPSMWSRCSWCKAPRRRVSWATLALPAVYRFRLFLILISQKRGRSISSRMLMILWLPCIHENLYSNSHQVMLLSEASVLKASFTAGTITAKKWLTQMYDANYLISMLAMGLELHYSGDHVRKCRNMETLCYIQMSLR